MQVSLKSHAKADCGHIRQSMILCQRQTTLCPMFLEVSEIKQTWNQLTDARQNHISLNKIISLNLSSAGKSLNVRISAKDLGSCLTNHHMSSPCSLHRGSAVTGSLKIHCLGEKQLHHLLTALYLSFLVCKMGVLHFIQRIIMRSIEIKHVKCLVQGLAHRKCLVIVSCYVVRHFQYWNTHMDF